MLNFNEITLGDKEVLESFFKKSNLRSEEYNFQFSYIWRLILNYAWTQIGDYAVIRASIPERPQSFLFPAGEGDVKPVIDELAAYTAEVGQPLLFHTVLEPSKAILETLYPNCFEFTRVNDYDDYIYDTKSLISLSGKKLHSKKNHLNSFKAQYPDWSFEEITHDNIDDVIAMNDKWCGINCVNAERSLFHEACSVREALGEFFALGFQGGLLRVGGDAAAFSLGTPLTADTYLIHIEKALADIKGAYAAINQMFAEHFCAEYVYIDREDDSGSAGLRKAKQSYKPIMMAEKYAAKML
jgi:hypothetical protein